MSSKLNLRLRFYKINFFIITYYALFITSIVSLPLFVSLTNSKFDWFFYQIIFFISLVSGSTIKLRNSIRSIKNRFNRDIESINFLFLLFVYIFLQVSILIYYFINVEQISPSAKYLLFSDTDTFLWRFFSIFITIKNSIFFYISYFLVNQNNNKFDNSKFKYLYKLLFVLFIPLSLLIIYIDGLSMIAYTWPIFYKLIFFNLPLYLKRIQFGKLNLKIFGFLLLFPLFYFCENLINNKLFELGADRGLTIIDFDPKGIIETKNFLTYSIFNKSQILSIIYYYALEMFNTVKIITSTSGFCYYFLIPISKISEFLSDYDACNQITKNLYDNKLLGAWTIMGAVIGSKLGLIGVLIYGFFLGGIISFIKNLVIRVQLLTGLVNDPFGVNELIMILVISNLIINPDVYTYLAIVFSATFIPLLISKKRGTII